MHRVRFSVLVGLEIGIFAVGRWQEDGNQPTDKVRIPKGVIAASLGWRSWQANRARVAQLVEHVLGKDEVIGSSPIAGSIRSQNLCTRVQEEVLLVSWLGVLAKSQ